MHNIRNLRPGDSTLDTDEMAPLNGSTNWPSHDFNLLREQARLTTR